MRIFFSGYLTMAEAYLGEDADKIENALVAFPEMKNRKQINIPKNVNIFLDSGGFSIRNRGLNLSIDDYVEYVKKFGKYYEIIANMDTNDTKETLHNQRRLEKETGHKILPVYHRSELKSGDKDLLKYYCQNYDFVALGGVAGIGMSKAEKRYYLDFSFKTAMEYKTKLHGFGITSYSELLRYPFYTIDSTSWLQGVKFNKFMVFNDGRIKSFTSKEYRDRFGIDYAKISYKDRLLFNYYSFQKMADYISKLHKAKGMKYREN